MSAAPQERWRQRLHDLFSVDETRPAADAASASTRLARAERLRAAARRRDATFGCDLFAEPAFDLLLDLYIAEQGGGPAAAHLSTGGAREIGWRYAKVMEHRGLLACHPGGRLRLTPAATAAMERYLDGL
jgi:hypothetical protein